MGINGGIGELWHWALLIIPTLYRRTWIIHSICVHSETFDQTRDMITFDINILEYPNEAGKTMLIKAGLYDLSAWLVSASCSSTNYIFNLANAAFFKSFKQLDKARASNNVQPNQNDTDNGYCNQFIECVGNSEAKKWRIIKPRAINKEKYQFTTL